VIVNNLNQNLLTFYLDVDSGGVSCSNNKYILLQSRVPRPHQLNDLSIRSYHTKSLSSLRTPLELKPWFITGFTDGEGSFSISVRNIDKDTKKGKVLYVFSIILHKKDEGILRSISSAVITLLLGYFHKFKDRCSFDLEWALHNPPKPYAFTHLPLQSKLQHPHAGYFWWMMHRRNVHAHESNAPTSEHIQSYYQKYIEPLTPEQLNNFDRKLIRIDDKFLDKIRGNGMQQCPNHGVKYVQNSDCKGSYIFEHHELNPLMNIMHNDEIQSILFVVNREWVICLRYLIMYFMIKNGYNFKIIWSFISSNIINVIKILANNVSSIIFLYLAIISSMVFLLISGNYLDASFVSYDVLKAWELYFQNSASPPNNIFSGYRNYLQYSTNYPLILSSNNIKRNRSFSTSILPYNSVTRGSLLNLKEIPRRKFYCSTSLNRDLLSDEDFYEWLRGLIDGEGCFYIRKNLIR